MYIERGKAHTPRLSTQVRDFSGLRWRNITPTDLDCSMDFGGKLFVFVEAKLPSIPLPYGQRLHLERLTDAVLSGGKHSIAIICEHTNRNGVIDFATCVVTEFRWHGQWYTPKSPVTVKVAVDRVLFKFGLSF